MMASDRSSSLELIMLLPECKSGLDALMVSLREQFVFDNVAIYAPTAQGPQVLYARAMGRGQTSEADAAWGLDTAENVFTAGQVIEHTPVSEAPLTDRVHRPSLLGCPIHLPEGGKGALVFIRFGGPTYPPQQILLATFAAEQAGLLWQIAGLKTKVAELEEGMREVRLQEDFLATVSHELRTPLGFIKGYTTTLLRPDAHWDDTTRTEFLTIIDEEADRLTALIENILESARLQSHTLSMSFQLIRLESLIRDLALRNSAHYANMQIDLDLQVCPPLEGDALRLAEVLENLFSNAAKYAPGARVKISLHEHGDSQRITFSDNGPGIPEENLPHIFNRFYRVPGEKSSGTGLGLFICREIVEAHHGEMTARSAPGQGTVFIIYLPTHQNKPDEVK